MNDFYSTNRRNLGQKKIWQIYFYSLVLVLVLLFNLGCGVLSAIGTLTNTPTLTPTASLTSTATSIPTVTRSPTFTPSPTLTSSPTFTVTPVGFYSSHKFGFSLTYPMGWYVYKETQTQVWITSDNYDMGFVGQSIVNNALPLKTNLSIVTELFRDPSLGFFSISTLGANDPITLGDGTNALRQVVQGKSPKGTSLTIQIVCARTDTKVYAFVVFGYRTSLKDHANDVNGIYKTIRLDQTDTF
ncbi:MAG TPA: hypothetical protein VKF38_03995 [Anaerolineaceae bacterium]|nr:hypothetical protein [Anaerolineaceae bacterium]